MEGRLVLVMFWWYFEWPCWWLPSYSLSGGFASTFTSTWKATSRATKTKTKTSQGLALLPLTPPLLEASRKLASNV